MNDSLKDIAIIERILQGDASGYKELVHRHKNYAFTVAFRILNHREIAEEAAQDAFIQAFKALKTFNRESKFTTWFYRIVFNAAVGYKRKEKIQKDDLETVETSLQISDTGDDIRHAEQKKYIGLALKNMSEDDVTLITLFYLKEFSMEEISEITGISADTAKVKLHRARKRLAEEMKKLLKSEVRSIL